MLPNFLFFQELVEKLSKGELSKEEYPCLNDPSPTLNQAPNAHSMRSRRAPTWAAQHCNSVDGISRYIILLNLLLLCTMVVCSVHLIFFNGLHFIPLFLNLITCMVTKPYQYNQSFLWDSCILEIFAFINRAKYVRVPFR